MTAHCIVPHAIPFVVISDAEHVRNILCGPAQHNEHCKGWRWHMYVQDDAKRMANVMAEVRAMHAERRAAMSSQEEADIELAMWQARREARGLVFA